ncbi:MAG TPA: sulfite exporter TauE/SafE family protein [Thermoanaerobaculia bacterium]|nr:sulfite exporter TauE/SafE family protein [Thermoanaerobaculia bacterium]
MSPLQLLLLVAAAAGGGIMNAMAGGGTILVFPALLFLGQPAISANATATVGLLPGAAASLFGYRQEVLTHRAWLKTLFLPSLLGGTIGSVLLLSTPERIFAHLAPVLILFATVLFMLQGVLARRREARPDAATLDDPGHLPWKRWAVASACQFAISIYGGYFGAAIGILMLAVLGFLGLQDIHAMNGLKNFFNLAINSVAATYFIVRGVVSWPAALVIVVGATLGGYGGARFARRIGREKARAAVVVIGLVVTAILFWQQWR